MPRWILLLVLFSLVYGGHHAAAVLFRLMDPSEAIAIEADGTHTHMAFGLHLPRPDWVPVPPDATLIQAAKVTPAASEGIGSLDVSTRMELEPLRRFYRDVLTHAGFAVDDQGLGPLNPGTAALLGVAAMLVAERATTRDQVSIHIRTPEGLIPSRLVQMNWRKLPAATAEARN